MDEALGQARALLESLSLTSAAAARHGLAVNQDGQRRTAFQLLAFQDVTISKLSTIWPELDAIAPKLAERIENDARYAVYLDRQQADIDSYRA